MKKTFLFFATVMMIFAATSFISCGGGSGDGGGSSSVTSETYTGSFSVNGKTFTSLTIKDDGTYTMTGSGTSDNGTYVKAGSRAVVTMTGTFTFTSKSLKNDYDEYVIFYVTITASGSSAIITLSSVTKREEGYCLATGSGSLKADSGSSSGGSSGGGSSSGTYTGKASGLKESAFNGEYYRGKFTCKDGSLTATLYAFTNNQFYLEESVSGSARQKLKGTYTTRGNFKEGYIYLTVTHEYEYGDWMDCDEDYDETPTFNCKIEGSSFTLKWQSVSGESAYDYAFTGGGDIDYKGGSSSGGSGGSGSGSSSGSGDTGKEDDSGNSETTPDGVSEASATLAGPTSGLYKIVDAEDGEVFSYIDFSNKKAYFEYEGEKLELDITVSNHTISITYEGYTAQFYTCSDGSGGWWVLLSEEEYKPAKSNGGLYQKFTTTYETVDGDTITFNKDGTYDAVYEEGKWTNKNGIITAGDYTFVYLNKSIYPAEAKLVKHTGAMTF